MTYSLFELSQNQKVQDKARANIKEVLKKHNGKFTYEAMMEMTYLENVILGRLHEVISTLNSFSLTITESLRKYPPLTNLTRVCMKDYRVEGTNFVIKKGQMVFIPVIAFHHDPDIFTDPLAFDPDRFLLDEQEKRPPYSFLSFGYGPRNCIGCEFKFVVFQCQTISWKFQ
jgi:cytochrome P450 family 6